MDLISRQAAIDAIYKCTDIYVNNLPVMIDKADAYKALADLPSAQPERKRGKWIPVTKVYKSSMKMYPFPEVYFEWTDAAEHDEIEGVKCSECDAVYDFTEAQNFCPNCGAQMER